MDEETQQLYNEARNSLLEKIGSIRSSHSRFPEKLVRGELESVADDLDTVSREAAFLAHLLRGERDRRDKVNDTPEKRLSRLLYPRGR